MDKEGPPEFNGLVAEYPANHVIVEKTTALSVKAGEEYGAQHGDAFS